jgi:hypothetical protein
VFTPTLIFVGFYSVVAYSKIGSKTVLLPIQNLVAKLCAADSEIGSDCGVIFCLTFF